MSTHKIKQRILRKGRGTVFTPAAFLGLGSRASIDKTLSRLADSGFIRRLARGVYDYPKISSRLGPLTPSPDIIAKAIADGAGQTLLISPAHAANLFGLTTQVPAKAVYLTDGPTRTQQVGGYSIQFRNASAKTLIGAGRISGAVLQALRYLGKDGVNSAALHKISQALSDDDKAMLIKDSRKAPAWMQDPVQQITASPSAMAA